MTYNPEQADRVRNALARQKGLSERKMFGGIAFMINGHMCCGVINDDLVLRLGNERTAEALTEPHTREMDFTGKPLKTMVCVAPKGFRDDHDLARWVKRAVGFVRTLPDKK